MCARSIRCAPRSRSSPSSRSGTRRDDRFRARAGRRNEALLATIDAGDDRTSISTELALHGLVFEASGHRLLQRAWHGLRGRLQLYWAAHHRAHGRRGPRRDSHDSYIAAALGDDLDALRLEIADHMRRGAVITEKFVSGQPSSGRKGRHDMTIKRRTILVSGPPWVRRSEPCRSLARARRHLEETKKRGTFRVGVTQAPPWFSKDPKTGEWSSGARHLHGQGDGRCARRQAGDVEVSWGNAIAALQSDKIDIMFTLDATPERKQAVDFPEFAAALLFAGRAGARRPGREDLGRPQQARRAHRRAAGLVDGPLRERDTPPRPTCSASPTMPRPSRPSSRAASMPCACSIRRCSPPASASARARSWCRRRRSRRPRARPSARTTRSSSPGSISSSPVLQERPDAEMVRGRAQRLRPRSRARPADHEGNDQVSALAVPACISGTSRRSSPTPTCWRRAC